MDGEKNRHTSHREGKPPLASLGGLGDLGDLGDLGVSRLLKNP
jgi:hypothetical protein